MNRISMNATALSLLLAVIAGFGFSRAQDKPKETSDAPKAQAAAAPDIAGSWTGDWGMYIPPPKNGEQPAALKKMMYPEMSLKMDCKVEALADGKYQATFEGDAHGPYKYTIKMPGRQAGKVVLFQGSADLGEKDGGVFDWIGRATDKEFVGFFTSRGYTGTFRLTHLPK
jgi:hypothetical protein